MIGWVDLGRDWDWDLGSRGGEVLRKEWKVTLLFFMARLSTLVLVLVLVLIWG